MRVHVIKAQTIEDYCKHNPAARIPFAEWLAKQKRAEWDKPDDIIATFGSADILGKGSSRVVFDLGGNNYRMICRYKFSKMVHLSIKWIGTHAEYDKLCGFGKKMKKRSQDPDQYTINNY